MKKLVAIICAAVITLMLSCACAERDLPHGSYKEMGKGTVYIATEGGASSSRKAPMICPDGDRETIGLSAWGFDGDALSFIYVDGMLLESMRLENTYASMTLQGVQLADGFHTIEVVQYTNDDPSGEMITYRQMEYQVGENTPYIGNKNTRKLHEASCSSVEDMKDRNKVGFATKEEALEDGYETCQRCNP